MRKAVAFLLACILVISACLVSQADGITIKMQTDKTAMQAAFGDEWSAEMIDGLCELLECITLQTVWNETSIEEKAYVGTTEVFDMTLAKTDDGLFLTTSLFPDCLFQMSDQQLLEELTLSADWFGIAVEALIAVTSQINELPTVRQEGSFAGMLYDDGIVRNTWFVDDKAMTGIVDQVVDLLADALFFDSDIQTFSGTIHEVNRIISDENRYLVCFDLVERKNDRNPVATVKAYDHGEMIGSLSVQPDETGCKAVLYLPLEASDAYLAFTLKKDVETGDGIMLLETYQSSIGKSYEEVCQLSVPALRIGILGHRDDGEVSIHTEVTSCGESWTNHTSVWMQKETRFTSSFSRPATAKPFLTVTAAQNDLTPILVDWGQQQQLQVFSLDRNAIDQAQLQKAAVQGMLAFSASILQAMPASARSFLLQIIR